MSEPSPEKKSFFQNHIQELGSLIERTNVKRASRRFPVLTEEEIDKALDDLMYLKDPKAAIASYQFKDPQENPPQDNSQEQPPDVQGDKFRFEVIKCSNGYLMTMRDDCGAKTFIFKSLGELSEIFEQVLFSEERPQKEEPRKVINARVKKAA